MAGTLTENTETCKQIALEIEHYTEDGWYKCPLCGGIIEWNDEFYDSNEGTYTCPHCEETFDENELEALSIYEYFNDTDIYNIEYRINGAGEYRSVELMI